MSYDYDRTKTARVPGEFPETEFDRFSKNLNYTLQAAGEIKKIFERDRRTPKKLKAMTDIIKELLEIREDMLWVATEKGDGVRTRR